MAQNHAEIVLGVIYYKNSEQPNTPNSSWYVGITDNPKERLASHNVDPKHVPVIVLEATNCQEARTAEATLLEDGFDGGTGGGDGDTRFVYAYLKTSWTKQ